MLPNAAPSLLARELLLRIESCNRGAIGKTGEFNLHAVADLLDRALEEPAGRQGLLLGLAEFIATAVDGSPIDIHKWVPLVPPQSGAAKPPIRLI